MARDVVRRCVAATVPCLVVMTACAADAPVPAFDLLDFQIDGNTRLSQIELERAVYRFLGPQRGTADVEGARAALEQAYHAAGYLTVFVDVPPQRIEQGRVRLQVTEGRIERLKVSGSQYHSPQAMRDEVPALREGAVPDFNAMQRQLAQLNRGADLQATPVLRPGHASGTVEAELKVQDQLPLHGSVALNNRYSEGTPHTRLEAALRYDNLWQRGHSASLSWATAPGHLDQTAVWHASYSLPWQDGTLSFYGLHSSSAVSAVGDVSVLGAGTVIGTRWYSPALDVNGWYHSVSAGLDRKDFNQSVRLGESGYDTPIVYLPLQLQWQTLRFAPDGSRSSASLAANFALRGVGSRDAPFEDNRYNAHASYFYLRGEAQTTQALGASRLVLRGSGQLASQPLISNEQFAAGGADSVRGYTESARAGDQGLCVSAEWQSAPLAWPAWLGGSGAAGEGELRWLAFYDWATLRVLDPLPEQTPDFVLASVGLGLRAKAGSRLTASLDVAQPLQPDARGQQPVRLHGSVAVEF
jgi:hemolysin activation/secretion protein